MDGDGRRKGGDEKRIKKNNTRQDRDKRTFAITKSLSDPAYTPSSSQEVKGDVGVGLGFAQTQKELNKRKN